MSTEENKATMRRVYDTFNRAVSTGDMSLLDEALAADLVDHNPVPGQAPGLEGVKQVFSQFRAAFPDFRIMVDDQIAEGDKVVSRLTLRGTHKGDFQGVPATGKQFAVTGIDIVHVAGGKAGDRWGELDNLGLLQQLGVVPPPGQ